MSVENLNIEKIKIDDLRIINALFGNLDENVKFIEKKFGVFIQLEDGFIVVKSEHPGNEKSAKKLIETLISVLKRQRDVGIADIEYIIDQKKREPEIDFEKPYDEAIVYCSNGKVIRPKTIGQKRYIDSIKNNEITFGIGPAGTGKTYLAVAMAVKAFKNKSIGRIILTRPAVEAGESLGFLPGDLQMKVDPYLRPLYDAIFDMMGSDSFQKLMEKNIIEVAPLAYMRGRTLDNAYIILDEAQNTTDEQMKMFLTRIGQGSKAIVNGDITQVDLKRGQNSGLKSVVKILKDIRGINFVYLDKTDVVRHRIVQKIIEAYERAEKEKSQNEDQ